MICLICGNEIKKNQQVPIIINVLEMAVPWNESGAIGNDTLKLKYMCQPCYKSIMQNAALASSEMSDILIKTKQPR